MSIDNMQNILEHTVSKGAVALWWLGQNGFLIKTLEGKVIAIDAYLSNSCQEIGERAGLNFTRQIPVPLCPEACLLYTSPSPRD